MVKRGTWGAMIVGAVMISGCTAAAAQSDPVADGLALLPGVVEDVRVGGTWDREGQNGVYRIIITRSGGNDVVARLFVQWVAYHTDGTATLMESIEIDELAELDIDIVDYMSESDGDGLAVFIQADNPSANGEESFELFVFSPGDYMFGPASN